MNTGEHVLDSMVEADRFVRQLAEARGTPDVLVTVRDYLSAWSTQRVACVQRIDAGWAPFDEKQKPSPVYRSADVNKICDAVHCQCVALKGAGVDLSPEILELDLVLSLACARMAEFDSTTAPRNAPQAPMRDAAPGQAGLRSGSGQP